MMSTACLFYSPVVSDIAVLGRKGKEGCGSKQ